MLHLHLLRLVFLDGIWFLIALHGIKEKRRLPNLVTKKKRLRTISFSLLRNRLQLGGCFLCSSFQGTFCETKDHHQRFLVSLLPESNSLFYLFSDLISGEGEDLGCLGLINVVLCYCMVLDHCSRGVNFQSVVGGGGWEWHLQWFRSWERTTNTCEIFQQKVFFFFFLRALIHLYLVGLSFFGGFLAHIWHEMGTTGNFSVLSIASYILW